VKKAREFDDQESLGVPVNHLLAIIADEDKAKVVVESLTRNGFSPDEIGILKATAGAEKLGAVTGHKGFFAKILTCGIDMGDRDTDYLEQYRRALLNGLTVVGVAAKNDEAREKGTRILKTCRARFITFFGRFVTEVLHC
jgi:hypothetical protein